MLERIRKVQRLEPRRELIEGLDQQSGVAVPQSAVAKWVAGSFAAYALLASVVSLFGWFANLPRLTDWIDSGIAMFANTALAGSCTGIALLVLLWNKRWSSVITASMGAVVGLLGGLTLFEHFSGINIGIDTFLIEPLWGHRSAMAPGRMGPPASLSFVLLGTGLILLSTGRFRRVVPILGLIPLALCLLAIVGYSFAADPLFSIARITGIALQTATVILALGISLAATVPEKEPVRTLLEQNAAGVLMRRALPFVVGVPIGLGWIFVEGRQHGLVDRGMGTAMLVLALITLFSALLWWCSRAVADHERRSRNNEARFRSCFELGLIGMAIISPEKGMIEVNDKLCEVLGSSRDELLRSNWVDWTHPDDLTAELVEFNRVLAGDINSYSVEKRLIRKDERVIHGVTSVCCVRRPDGAPDYFVALLQDITERKLAEDRLRLAHAELELRVQERTASLRSAIAQMEEFSYTVSHDLRAPLRGMKVYARTLLEDYAASLPEEAAQYLKRIDLNAERLDKMILDVLTFSRLAGAELPLQRVSVDRLARQIVEEYPGLNGSEVKVEIEPLPDVIAHEASLTQALSNLLNNAVKFVAPNVAPRVRVWAERENGHVRVWIADNGIGIDPKYHRRLFNMFERIHRDLKYDGTGVGLAIVRKAVERMGGKVGVESDGVNGSRFWLEVKAADQTK